MALRLQFSLLNVGNFEFTILFRVINALQEMFALLFFREVEKEFDDSGAVAVEMRLQVHDGTIPLLPKSLASRSTPRAAPDRAVFPDARER